MQIAIVGSGRVGSALAGRFAAAGHQVRFASRDAGGTSPVEGVERVPLDAVGNVDLVVFATPAPAVAESVAAMGDLGDAVVVDATNPFGLPEGTSTVEAITSAAPRAGVVKAFNTLGFDVLGDPTFADGTPVLTMCGDDADAVATVRGLATEAGFQPLVLGGLDQAPLAEAFARVWITLSRGELGRDFAFGLLQR